MEKTKVEIITTAEKFASLKDEWNHLLENSGLDNVFLTWEWQFNWWKAFGQDLFLVLFREKYGSLEAIFPMHIARNKTWFNNTIKEMRFIGSDGEVPSEYLDFICLKEKNKEICEIFVDLIISKSGQWDILSLREVKKESSNIQQIKELLIRKGKKVITKEENSLCPLIDLSGTKEWEGFLQSIDKYLRQNVRRWERKVKKDFKVEYFQYNSLESSNGFFEKLKELHGLRRQDKGESNRFANERYLAFHKNILASFSRNKWLHLNVLQLDSQIVAIKYNYQFKNRIYSYQGGWDPKYAKYNVAQVLFSYILKDAIAKGREVIDLLRGDENYKMKWANYINRKIRVSIPLTAQGKYFLTYVRTKKLCKTFLKKLVRSNFLNSNRE